MENEKEVSNGVKVLSFTIHLLSFLALFNLLFLNKELRNWTTYLLLPFLFVGFFVGFKYRKEEMAVLSTLNETTVWILVIFSFAIAIAAIVGISGNLQI
jgi:hypothetical protein